MTSQPQKKMVTLTIGCVTGYGQTLCVLQCSGSTNTSSIGYDVCRSNLPRKMDLTKTKSSPKVMNERDLKSAGGHRFVTLKKGKASHKRRDHMHVKRQNSHVDRQRKHSHVDRQRDHAHVDRQGEHMHLDRHMKDHTHVDRQWDHTPVDRQWDHTHVQRDHTLVDRQREHSHIYVDKQKERSHVVDRQREHSHVDRQREHSHVVDRQRKHSHVVDRQREHSHVVDRQKEHSHVDRQKDDKQEFSLTDSGEQTKSVLPKSQRLVKQLLSTDSAINLVQKLLGKLEGIGSRTILVPRLG